MAASLCIFASGLVAGALLGRLLSVTVGSGALFGNLVLFIDIAALLGTFAMLLLSNAVPRARVLLSLALTCQAAVVALVAVGVKPPSMVASVQDLYNIAAFVAIAGFACVAGSTGVTAAARAQQAPSLGDRVRLPPRVQVERSETR